MECKASIASLSCTHLINAAYTLWVSTTALTLPPWYRQSCVWPMPRPVTASKAHVCVCTAALVPSCILAFMCHVPSHVCRGPTCMLVELTSYLCKIIAVFHQARPMSHDCTYMSWHAGRYICAYTLLLLYPLGTFYTIYVAIAWKQRVSKWWTLNSVG